ncbi:Putative pre-mRNA-splicing factor SPF27 [Septoria linicola]|uniref:Pre-mRNA-splicing factor SPF27 n=1 Tax=Septoria linicola TaxID=215465 RepID=A0A9Q9ASM5_9PEZI|nr:putative pre-mRNA-splicing factor SPF27 [Septoria linicola]USW53919.1 Putative pre-mRNA-splicing factor SPF27 [Septoria linicola]
MPLIQHAPDALPYVDAPVSEETMQAANALIHAELDAAHTSTTLHPSIPAQKASHFSDSVEAEHARIAAGQPKDGGLDLSRYELLDAPAKGDLSAWKESLQKAYASAEYLRGREVNLSLLETYGKNAWLISNSQLEDELKSLEKELESAKIEQEQLEQGRRAAQANAAGEMQGLEEAWKTGVGRMIETQAAAERLRLEILQRKRQGVA